MEFEELKQQFIDNGFEVNGNTFSHMTEDQSNVVIINGQRQTRMIRFEMEYIGEGCDIDSDGSDGEIFHEFNIIGEGHRPVCTVCVSDFEDFKVLVNR